MKRLSFERKCWLARHARRSALRRSAKAEHIRAEIREIQELVRNRRLSGGIRPSLRRDGRAVVIGAPSKFSLAQNHDGVVAFIELIREFALRQRRRTTASFKEIDEVSPGAALYLAAELDRWRRCRKLKLRAKDVDTWNPAVHQAFLDMGLFDLLHVLNPVPREEQRERIRMLKFRSGNVAEGNDALRLRVDLEEMAGVETDRPSLFAGITEAMSNVIRHAYPAEQVRDIPWIDREWWMTASYDPGDRRMRVLFFDQGVGIPATLPRSRRSEQFQAKLQSWGLAFGVDDAQMIRAAMEVGRTADPNTGQGHGLEDIRRIVANAQNGRLRILSGRGVFTHSSDGSETTRNEEQDLGGTLIEWDIVLPAASNRAIIGKGGEG